MLIGERSPGGARIVEVTSGRNLEVERPHDRFTLDPVHLMTAEIEARARGLEVVGLWHSHPGRPAVPSDVDRVAAWEGWSHVIVSIRGGRPPEICSWRLDDAVFVEQAVSAQRGLLQ